MHQAFFDQQNYKQVVKQCEAQLKKDGKQTEIRIFLAMAKQKLGEPREALAILSSIVKVGFVLLLHLYVTALLNTFFKKKKGGEAHRF